MSDKIRRLVGIILISAIVLVSCEDIIVEDISSDTVLLRAPADNIVTNTKKHLLWWDELPGVSQYKLIVVSPDYESPSIMLLDTLVTDNTFEVELNAGKYQWCVSGQNTGYKTSYNCRTMEITNE
ncbi:hypothetical protein [Chryseosolibacter indicus]|uniref:Uncharacterized protein n=1 Tax=Chryseosolibacter indicus TaxID=2782351 RepID=A0ABS5VXH2_9BACT|nr:hypothetical protein [Chryseosolibacter indicus]MBT1705599.1 hypothetical protein [Chryseosolibacter indicus]